MKRDGDLTNPNYIVIILGIIKIIFQRREGANLSVFFFGSLGLNTSLSSRFSLSSNPLWSRLCWVLVPWLLQIRSQPPLQVFSLSCSRFSALSRVYALHLPLLPPSGLRCRLPSPLLLPPPLFLLKFVIIPSVRNWNPSAPGRAGVFAPATLPSSVIDARKLIILSTFIDCLYHFVLVLSCFEL